jgi:hypothetical protein
MRPRRRASGGLARGAIGGIAVTTVLLVGACSDRDEWTRNQCLERSHEVVGALPQSSDAEAQEAYARRLQDLNAELAAHKCLGLDEEQPPPGD